MPKKYLVTRDEIADIERLASSADDTAKDALSKAEDALAATNAGVGDGAVTTEKLANESVTLEKLAEETMDAFAPAYEAGTEDLTAGTSELETGKLYFVYE